MIDKTELIMNIMERWNAQGVSGIVLVLLLFHQMKSGNINLIFRFMSGIRKKNRLKKILNEKYTSPETHARVLLELRQKDNMWLTGMLTPGLANIIIELTKQNNLCLHHFYNWRRWLTENEGKINFDEEGYINARREHYVMSSVGLLYALIMSLDIYLRFNLPLLYMPYVAYANIVIFMGLMIFISWVPGKEQTMKMKVYISKYNSELLLGGDSGKNNSD